MACTSDSRARHARLAGKARHVESWLARLACRALESAGGFFLQPAARCGKRHGVVEARVTPSRGREPLCPQVSRARLACRARRSHADGFLILLNVEREKRGIPCQDTDLVDFMQVIR